MCLFCKIINGEIPCYKVYEDNDFLAFLDISQATVGHTLVIPKKHVANVFELDDETASKMLIVVKFGWWVFGWSLLCFLIFSAYLNISKIK